MRQNRVTDFQLLDVVDAPPSRSRRDAPRLSGGGTPPRVSRHRADRKAPGPPVSVQRAGRRTAAVTRGTESANPRDQGRDCPVRGSSDRQFPDRSSSLSIPFRASWPWYMPPWRPDPDGYGRRQWRNAMIRKQIEKLFGLPAAIADGVELHGRSHDQGAGGVGWPVAGPGCSGNRGGISSRRPQPPGRRPRIRP